MHKTQAWDLLPVIEWVTQISKYKREMVEGMRDQVVKWGFFFSN